MCAAWCAPASRGGEALLPGGLRRPRQLSRALGFISLTCPEPAPELGRGDDDERCVRSLSLSPPLPPPLHRSHTPRHEAHDPAGPSPLARQPRHWRLGLALRECVPAPPSSGLAPFAGMPRPSSDLLSARSQSRPSDSPLKVRSQMLPGQAPPADAPSGAGRSSQDAGRLAPQPDALPSCTQHLRSRRTRRFLPRPRPLCAARPHPCSLAFATDKLTALASLLTGAWIESSTTGGILLFTSSAVEHAATQRDIKPGAAGLLGGIVGGAAQAYLAMCALPSVTLPGPPPDETNE